MSAADELRTRAFATVSDLIAAHAADKPNARALVQNSDALSYAELDALLDRIAAGLQRDGVRQRDAVAIVSSTTLLSTAVFLGALRAGSVPAPIAPSATPEQIGGMVADSRAPILFVDADAAVDLTRPAVRMVHLDDLEEWLPPAGARPASVVVEPQDPFNIIYSSGTTGTPKGIVHDHRMRWTQIAAYAAAGFDRSVTIVATPVYSNTTLVSLLPTIGHGGAAVLMGKFDARRFLEIAERERATHVMLVPVQYQRLMAVPDFDRFDLSSFRFKSCTSAPFSAELKADVVKRWPGLLLEVYGMTEGGGTCLLYANAFPGKLHTVGQPAPGNDIRIIGEDGCELPRGEIGEVVGRSGVMMAGYHGRPDATSAAEWLDAEGNRFIRHGDLGRFDEDGFLTLVGRSKDMIISGGFNIYPADIEGVMREHPAVFDAAVIGVPSAAWGETPYAYYVAKADGVTSDEIVAWVNARVGKTQRLSGATQLDELPRSAIGKVLNRKLRDAFEAAQAA